MTHCRWDTGILRQRQRTPMVVSLLQQVGRSATGHRASLIETNSSCLSHWIVIIWAVVHEHWTTSEADGWTLSLLSAHASDAATLWLQVLMMLLQHQGICKTVFGQQTKGNPRCFLSFCQEFSCYLFAPEQFPSRYWLWGSSLDHQTTSSCRSISMLYFTSTQLLHHTMF